MNQLDAQHIVVMLLAATIFIVWCCFVATNPIICNQIVNIAQRIRDLGDSKEVRKLKEEINFLKGIENDKATIRFRGRGFHG